MNKRKIVKKKEIRDLIEELERISGIVDESTPKYRLIDKIRNIIPWNKNKEEN